MEKPPKVQTTCKSYSKISDVVIDLFTEAKTIFFSFICSIVKPYLKKYQCEKPMYVDLKSIATNLLQLIVKPEVLEKCKTVKQLAEINLDKKGNLLPINKVELSFWCSWLLSKFNKQDITIDKTKKIKKEAQCFVVSTLKKSF